MKVIYLASFQALHSRFDVTYQDINGKRDIGGDMLDVDLTPYDVIIATPPCNYYSRANWRRETSQYSLITRHLLPSIIKKLSLQDKPFIIENVINKKLILPLVPTDVIYLEHGRHCYITNVLFNPYGIDQIDDLENRIIQSGKYKGKIGTFAPNSKRQGGINVHKVIDYWLDIVNSLTIK